MREREERREVSERDGGERVIWGSEREGGRTECEREEGKDRGKRVSDIE